MDVWKAATERGRTHGDVLTLAAGQPSTPAPQPVLRATRECSTRQLLGYTETFGILPLREAIAGHHSRHLRYRRRRRRRRRDHRVVGCVHADLPRRVRRGDTVVVARPGYPAYRNTLAALGCNVIELDCGPDTRFQPTVAMLDALPEPPAGLIVASPANPTGTIIDPAELAALARWCDEHGTLLISDEIYHGIGYRRAGDDESRGRRRANRW